jgi:hypothetical protein
MKRRNDRRIRLGFQWEAESWDDAPFWFDTLFRTLQGHRVHWNLPAMSIEIPSRRRAVIARSLRTRIESSGDLVTSMGYAGACHPFLNLDELDRELSWGLKNPWGTGITDILDLRPPVLIPQLPDLLRPEAGKMYEAHGFPLVGISTAAHDTSDTPAGWFPFLGYRAATLGSADAFARRLRRFAAVPADLFVMLDLSGEESASHLEAVLDALLSVFRTGPGLTLVEIPAQAAKAPAVPDRPTDWSSFPGPVIHGRIDAASVLVRKKRKKSEEFQRILTLMGPRGAADAAPSDADPDSSNSKRLVAHMLGDVVLAGTTFDVRLAGGRFCGMVRKGHDVLPGVPALSTLRTSLKDLTYQTVSSFSFEGESGTGLREELGLDGRGDTSISIEYSFREDSPHLSIRGEIRFPRFADSVRVDQYSPLTLALREVDRGQSIEVEAWAPDGSMSKATVAPDRPPVVLPGARHRLPRKDGGFIVLCYSCPDGGSWGMPAFRIARQKGKRYLFLNSFGSETPFPAAAISGRRERFSMLLGLEDA